MIQLKKKKSIKNSKRNQQKNTLQIKKRLGNKLTSKNKNILEAGSLTSYILNKDIIIFILTLLGSDFLYSKLTGNSLIIQFVKRFFKKIAFFLSRNLDISLALLLGSYLVSKDKYNLLIRIQYFVEQISELLNYDQTTNIYKIITQENFIFIIFLTFIYSFIGINGYRNLVNYLSKKIFNSIKYRSLIFCNIFNNISQFFHNDILKTNLGTIVTISSLSSIIKIIEDIIEVIFNSLNYQQKETLGALINLKNNLTLNQIHQISCIYSKFMYTSSWKLIKQTNQFLNYPIFNFKLIGIDIPIPKSITTIPNYKLSINIGLTPSIIFLTIIIKLLKYSYKEVIIKEFNYFMYYFFLVISYNNKIIKKVIDQQYLIENLKSSKYNIVLFYQSNHYNNILALIKFFQISTHLKLRDLDLYILELDLNEDSNFIKKNYLQQLPCIKFYEDNSEVYTISDKQIIYHKYNNTNNFKKSFINGLIHINYNYKKQSENNNDSNNNPKEYKDNNYIIKMYQIYNTLDFKIQNNMKYFFIDSFENAVFYNLDILSFGNCFNCFKDNQVLDNLFTQGFKNNNLILLYLYNDNLSETIDINNEENNEEDFNSINNFTGNYIDKEKQRKNKLIPKYSIVDNLESFYEFYKISSRIGNKTPNLTFIMSHVDAFISCKFYQKNYQLKINQLTMYYQKFARFNYDSYIPLINSTNDYTPLEYYIINDYKNILSY